MNISFKHRGQDTLPTYIIAGEVSKKAFDLSDKHIEMAKFR